MKVGEISMMMMQAAMASLPELAKKMRKLASTKFLNLRMLINGGGFAKFKKHYRLHREMGRGGFGVVYQATRISDELPVAVKFIERRHVREWGLLNEKRVPMELVMLIKCNRIPGVIAVLDWYSMPEGFLIVMERPVPGIDLFDFIRGQQRLDESLARFIFNQVVHTLARCMERRVLHRDIKDENIVIDLASGEAKLIDFGAATILKKSHYNDFQGTRLYCPPEWFLHSLYMGKEAAVWSLGVLLYNMLNGRLPFRSEKDICTAHLLGPLVFHAQISDDAQQLINRCLNFDPFKRCTMNELLAHPWLKMNEQEEGWEELLIACRVRKGQEMNNKSEESAESGVGTELVSSIVAEQHVQRVRQAVSYNVAEQHVQRVQQAVSSIVAEQHVQRVRQAVSSRQLVSVKPSMAKSTSKPMIYKAKSVNCSDLSVIYKAKSVNCSDLSVLQQLPKSTGIANNKNKIKCQQQIPKCSTLLAAALNC